MRLRLLAITLAVIAAVGCNRDPKVVARKYVDSGNRYYQAGKIKEASLMYRNALQKFPKFAEGHYRMALLALDQGDKALAFLELKKALQPDLDRDRLGLPLSLKVDATEKWADLIPELPRGTVSVAALEEVAKRWQADEPRSHIGPRLRGEAIVMELLLNAATLSNNDTRKFQNYRQWLDQADEARRNKTKPNVNATLEEALKFFRSASQAKPDDPAITFKIASVLNDLERTAEADQTLESLIGKKKAQPRHYLLLADVRMAKARSLEAAIPVLTAGIEHVFSGDKLPQDKWAFPMANRLIQLQTQLGRKEGVDKVIERVKQCGKNQAQVYKWAYTAYTMLNDASAAVRQLEEGTKALPAEKASFQKQLMFGYALQRKNTEALQIAEELLKANPKDVDARTMRTSFNLLRQDPNTSIKELEDIVAQSTRNSIAHFNLGRAYMMRGAAPDMKLARKQFETALEITPNHPDFRLALAQTQVAERDFQGALGNAERVLKSDPKRLAARLMRASALRGLGQTADARKDLLAILKDYPDNPDALLEMATLEGTGKNWKMAETYAAKSLAAAPESSRPFEMLILSIVQQNDRSRAIVAARAQVEKNPNRGDFRAMLGNLLVIANNLDAAMIEFQKAAESQASNTDRAIDMYLKMATIQRMKGDANGAIQTGLKARAMNPRNFQASAFLALAYDATGKSADARKVYDDALKLDPNNIVMLNNYAYLLAESGGDLDQALTYAQRALQQPRPPNSAPNAMDEVQDTVGWIYIKKQLPNNAVDLLRTIVERNPDNPVFRYHLAIALDQKGQKADVKKHLTIAMQKNPPAKELEAMKRLLAKQ